MEADTLVVPRAAFSLEEPWAIPSGCVSVDMRRSTDGKEPRLRTTVAMYADEECLTAIFVADDDEVVATHLEHDAPLYQEDVLELFLAPAQDAVYFEIEVNPLGSIFDARIESPEGTRKSMRADIEWTCAGLFAALRRTPRKLETVIRIPFASLGARRPDPGSAWRGNLFRIDRSSSGDEYTAWRPTMKNPPDFHVVAAFGRLQFS